MRAMLLNASTLNKGGGVQASASFILSALEDPAIDWHFAVSAQVDDEVRKYPIQLDRYTERSKRFDVSPARNTAARAELLRYEQDIGAAAVFTFFGPAYVRFRAPHLCGVANGLVTHAGMIVYRKLKSLRKIIVSLAGTVYRGYWYKQADSWVVEASVAKRGLARRFRIDPARIAIVQNSCGQQFLDYPKTSKPAHSTHRLLVASAYYPHKNLEIIPEVARALREKFKRTDFEFWITLDASSAPVARIMEHAKALGVENHIKLIGFRFSKDLPDLYQECDITFMPTLLETFSATYPESMCMQLPIVTTDLDFARDICDEAAEYYRHDDPVAAATSIHKVIEDRAYAQQLVQKGEKRLRSFPAPANKYEAYSGLIDSMLQHR